MKSLVRVFGLHIATATVGIVLLTLFAIFPLVAPKEETIHNSSGGVCIEEVWAMPMGYTAASQDHEEVIEEMRAQGKEPISATPSCGLAAN